MIRMRSIPIAASLLLLLVAAAQPAAAQPPNFSHLQRDTDVLQGTIEEISPASRTLTLQTQDGSRQTIHYDSETVVFNGDGSTAAEVVPGLEVLVRCRRQVTAAPEQRPDLCPVQLFADSVFLASY